ncbi:hypothetical protein MSAN_02105100 [Mycena sanguinolenta]|uniref:Uncharacterized protein n=1 Tax=Mycena sanguinolenta TaxID=230812 RepID=A0A8H7CKC9_9AGAR|nr:hypothetical protein MSAN_02105100 [Mycena sanguinolenta]
MDPSPIGPSWSALMEVFSEIGVSLVLYGIYLCLFALSIYILARRRGTHGTKLLMAWSCVIAAIATVRIAVYISKAIESARIVEELVSMQVSNPTLFITLGTAQLVLTAVNNLAADSLYLYRCYVIWGHRWKILILPALFMFATIAVGVAALCAKTSLIGTKPQFMYGLVVVTNLVLTSLTAGRLLWIRRTTSSVDVTNKFRSRCNRAIGLVLESGAIYCAAVTLLLVTASFKDPEVYAIEVGFGSQLMNIIPTFTLVYVGLDDTKLQKTEKDGEGV